MKPDLPLLTILRLSGMLPPSQAQEVVDEPAGRALQPRDNLPTAYPTNHSKDQTKVKGTRGQSLRHITTGRKGFTLIELLVVIAIIAILAAILFPVFAKARAKAHETKCLSNVKQIAMSLLMYANDHDGSFPMVTGNSSVTPAPTPNMTGLVPYTDMEYGIFKCPADDAARPPGAHPCSYGFAGVGTEYYAVGTYGWISSAGVVTPSRGVTTVSWPARHIVVADVSPTYIGATTDPATSRGTITTVHWNGWGAQRLGEANSPYVVGTSIKNLAIGRHQNRTLSNAAFADGHAKVLSKEIPATDAGSFPTVVSLGPGYPPQYTTRY